MSSTIPPDQQQVDGPRCESVSSESGSHKANSRPWAQQGYLRVESMVRHHTEKHHSKYRCDFKVKSPNVKYTEEYIESKYPYQTTSVQEHDDGTFTVEPRQIDYTFRTERKVPKFGVMLVGWGGNNGSTVTAAILANKHQIKWTSKDGIHEPDYFGSITQSATVGLGRNYETNQEVYVPLKSLLPMVDPNDIVLDGWDISSWNLADAMERAQVLEWDLQKKLRPYMEGLKPRPSIFAIDFVASNQQDRADHVIKGTKWEQVERIRSDIRDFKSKNKLDKVIILWTANTERYSDVAEGLNDTDENLLKSIKNNAKEVSPSTLFAVASILEGVTYINGSPQNTFVPGCLELAEKHQVFIAGDDFKSGQTKLKSVLVDFLISAGLKPVSIVSYNHLGNNDGKNLSAPKTFRSKEISKSNVVDDMVESNPILYEPGEHPDHCIVIKYIPYVGDSKRAMDEYTSEIMMGGRNTLVIHNTCEDSLLASPLILDLIILAEMCERITFKVDSDPEGYQRMHSVLSFLSYLCKAPLVPPGTPVVNALFKQRTCIENILKACIGLPPDNSMLMEFKQSRQVPGELFTSRLKTLSISDVAKQQQNEQQQRQTNGVKEEDEIVVTDGKVGANGDSKHDLSTLTGSLLKKVGDVVQRAQDTVDNLTGATPVPTKQ